MNFSSRMHASLDQTISVTNEHGVTFRRSKAFKAMGPSVFYWFPNLEKLANMTPDGMKKHFITEIGGMPQTCSHLSLGFTDLTYVRIGDPKTDSPKLSTTRLPRDTEIRTIRVVLGKSSVRQILFETEEPYEIFKAGIDSEDNKSTVVSREQFEVNKGEKLVGMFAKHYAQISTVGFIVANV